MADAPKGYQGLIAAIACGNGGLSSNLNPSRISVKNVIRAEGASFRQDHWRKEPGTALFGTNTVPVANQADLVIVALNDWHPTEAIQRLVHLRGDGTVYLTANGGTDPGAFTSGTTSGTGTRFGYFVTGGSEDGSQSRKLFLYRANKQPTYLNGDVTTDVVIPKPAADWSDAHPPIVGIINGNRQFAAGNSNNPHALYASKFGDHTDFQTVGGFTTDFQQLSVFPGVGERIYALRNFQGFIVVFKYPRGIFLQDARDTDPANWLTQQITDVIGIAATPYAAVQLENDVLFLGSDGQFYLLSAVIAAATGQQNMQTANLGMDLEIYQFLLEAYNRGLLNQVQSTYFPFWQTALFSVPSPSATQNNAILSFDFAAVGRKAGDPRFAYQYRDTAASLGLRRDPADFIWKPLYGDYTSHIIELEQDMRSTYTGDGYPFRVQTPHTNFGEFENLSYDRFVQFANRNKIFDFIEIEYLPFTAATITITVYVDGLVKQTITASLKLGGAPIGVDQTDVGAFTLGTSALAGGGTRSVVHRLNCGAGRRISFLFECNNADEDVAITHLFVYFRPGDTANPRS